MADYVSILLNSIGLLILQITGADGSHYFFRRYNYNYSYRLYQYYRSNSTNTKYYEYKGWYAGAAIGIVIGSFLFLICLSACLKHCIQRINRARLQVKPSTYVPPVITNNPNLERSTSYQMSNVQRPFNLHRQLQTDSFNRQLQRASTSNRQHNISNQVHKTTESDIFSIERQLPEYREICSPPPEYTAHDQQDIENDRSSGVFSPPPSYREATGREGTHS